MNRLFISGLANCHVRNLYSYVIRERIDEERGMIRVFHNYGNSLRSLLGDNDNYMLAPHNHRQNISLYQVRGAAYHVDFDLDERVSAGGTYEYGFNSEIADGGLGVYFHGTVGMQVLDIRKIDRIGIHLHSTSVHTVIAEMGSVWMVVEGRIAHHQSLCYSRKGEFKLDPTGLYQPLTETQLDCASGLLDRDCRSILHMLDCTISAE